MARGAVGAPLAVPLGRGCRGQACDELIAAGIAPTLSIDALEKDGQPFDTDLIVRPRRMLQVEGMRHVIGGGLSRTIIRHEKRPFQP